MKLIVHLNDLAMIEPLKNKGIEAITIGTDHFSTGGILKCDSQMIGEIMNQVQSQMKVYVMVNRLFHQHEISGLKSFLNQIKEVDGILFQDFGVLNIVQELGLKFEMIYAPDTLNTNHETLNTLYSLGVSSFMLASQLHQDELEDIVSKSKGKTMIQIHGVQYISCSRRMLLTNYFNQIGLKQASSYEEKLYIKVNKQEEYSYIYEDESGTHMYTMNELCTLDMDIPGEYGYIETLYLDNEYLLDVIDAYQQQNSMMNLKNKYLMHVYDQGFLEDGTVYTIEDVRKREENEKC